MRTLLLLTVAVACAEPARSVEPVRAPDRGPTSRDGAPPADAAAPPPGDALALAVPGDAAIAAAPAFVTSCPRGFRDVAEGTPCGPALQCPFAEGTCTCAPGRYCGGAAPHPDREAELAKLRWTCTPKPPKVRADGCPGVEPRGNKVRCATAGQICSYGDCCSFPYTCTKGRWIAGEASCPP